LQAHHVTARTAAYLYLLAGLSILLFVFWQSYGMLTHPVPGLNLPRPTANVAAAIDFGRMGAAAAEFVLRLVVLLVMVIVGSVIASRGVHIYHAASTAAAGKSSEAVSAPVLAMSDSGDASAAANGRQ
jgi:hypothetical protein